MYVNNFVSVDPYYVLLSKPFDSRWAEVLSLASRAELPKNYLAGSQGSLQADNTSTSSTEYENG